MKQKIHFWQSVNFKIAVAFILLLLISIEIIGNYFISSLEKNNIMSFEEGINPRVEQLSNILGEAMSNPDLSTTQVDTEIQKQVNNFGGQNVLEIRVIDDKGIIRAIRGDSQGLIGKKNDYKDLSDFSLKREETIDGNMRAFINIQPIHSATGDAILGAIYIKSNIQTVYDEIANISIIFFTASLIAVVISILVAIFISNSITKPIEEMRQAALGIAYGDYSTKVHIYGHDELSQLGITFNQLSERIQYTQDSMESERNRLNSVLAHMSDGVIATDRRGKVIVINEMALSQLNLSSEEAIGEDVLDLLGISGNYSLRKILEDNPNVLIEVFAEKVETITLRIDFSVIRRESGFISGVVVMLHDVTEEEKMEQERQEFVSNVSHELRTPLTSMKSYLEALSDGAWKDKEIAPNFINVSLEEANRMIRMINDLLNLSRMDAKRTQVEKEFVNFTDLVHFTLNRFDMMLKEDKKKKKKFTMKRQFTKRSLWVELDTDKMIQVIDNVMNNAIKYSPDGGIITIRLIETHNNVILSITDEGMGIPKKDLAKVFERFYRVDKARAREQGGTGLGLAISKEVVNAHGGRIWVESMEGRGSTFFISLPYEPFDEKGWDDE